MVASGYEDGFCVANFLGPRNLCLKVLFDVQCQHGTGIGERGCLSDHCRIYGMKLENSIITTEMNGRAFQNRREYELEISWARYQIQCSFIHKAWLILPTYS